LLLDYRVDISAFGGDYSNALQARTSKYLVSM
jgi:hypothetical protein